MNKSLRAVAFAAVLLTVALVSSGCNKLKARDQLNKGVQNYKSMHYESAIENFKNAVALDPKLSVAQLYLATAYAQSVVPGVDTPENNQNAEQAIAAFKKVIDDPKSDKQTRVASLKGIASIYFNQANGLAQSSSKNFDAAFQKLEQAKEYQKKIISEDPSDADAHYTIGVIDWTETFKPRMEARSKMGITKAEDPIKDKKACADLQGRNKPIVDEGINELQEAMKDRADYDDAMAYMNLMYREKADIECGDNGARSEDLKTADNWFQKTTETKKAKAEKQMQQSGIVLDNPQKK